MLQAVLPLLISLVLVAKAMATPAYPLKPSANGRYVVDSNNVPFLILGDAPHSILANLNNGLNPQTIYTINQVEVLDADAKLLPRRPANMRLGKNR